MKKIILIIFLTGGLSSCLYTPSAVNTPLFTKKGQVAATFNGIQNQHNIQAAYAITNNMAIMANRFKYKIDGDNWDDAEFSDKKDLNLEGNGYSNELGFGYFKKGKGKSSFEIYGGYGLGQSTFTPKVYVGPNPFGTGFIYENYVHSFKSISYLFNQVLG